jgi:hypothetical protein
MAQKIKFDRSILGWIAKSKAEEHPTTGPVANLMLPAQGYALALVSPDADVSDLMAGIEDVHPGARVIEITAPEGADEAETHRALLTLLLQSAGMPPAPGISIEELESSLPVILFPLVDVFIIYKAERLVVPSLNTLRRYKGMPPVVLVATSQKILETLSKDILLLRNVYFFPIES